MQAFLKTTSLRGLRPLVRHLGGAAPTEGLNFTLSSDQAALKDLARKFAREEIMPVAAHYDKTGEYPWPVIKKAWLLSLIFWPYFAQGGWSDECPY
jgi:acyl-CoA dehydrogenase